MHQIACEYAPLLSVPSYACMHVCMCVRKAFACALFLFMQCMYVCMYACVYVRTQGVCLLASSYCCVCMYTCVFVCMHCLIYAWT